MATACILFGGRSAGELFRDDVIRRALGVSYRYRERGRPFVWRKRVEVPKVVLILKSFSRYVSTMSARSP